MEWARRAVSPVAGEAAAQASHIQSCARCALRMQELEEARRELLGADPVVSSRRAAARILAEVDERRARKRWSWQRLLPIGLAPVLATVALVATTHTPSMGTAGDGPLASLPGFSRARAKGPLTMEVFCKRGESVFQVNEGADFFPGDRLRFSYSKGDSGNLTVFGVDDRGVVFPYYQNEALSGLPVPAGSRVMLPDSVELDDHKGWERIFAVWAPRGERAFSDQVLRDAVQTALNAAGGDIRKASKLPLPTEADQVSYLLRRP